MQSPTSDSASHPLADADASLPAFPASPSAVDHGIVNKPDAPVDGNTSPPSESARCGTVGEKAREQVHRLGARFKGTFPESSARLWFVLCILTLVGLSLYWLQYTIVQKWMAATTNPQQRFSFEQATALPAFFGVGLVAANTGYPLRQMTIAAKLSILAESWVPDTTVADFVACAPIPGFQFTVCQPVDAQKKPLLMQSDEQVQSLVGREALQASTSTWPRKLQLRATSESFCFTSHMLLNQSIIDTWPTPIIPGLNVIFLSASELRSSMAAVTGSLTQKLRTAQLVPPGQSVPMDTVTEMAASATQRFDLHGRAELTYQHALLGSMPTRNPLNNSIFNLLQITLAQQTPAVRDDWNAVFNTPGIRYAQTAMCVRTASFNVQVIQEIRTYTFQSFVSEVGGYIQVMILAFSLLFPLLWGVAVQPRTFLFTRLWTQARLLVTPGPAPAAAATPGDSDSDRQPKSKPKDSPAPLDIVDSPTAGTIVELSDVKVASHPTSPAAAAHDVAPLCSLQPQATTPAGEKLEAAAAASVAAPSDPARVDHETVTFHHTRNPTAADDTWTEL